MAVSVLLFMFAMLVGGCFPLIFTLSQTATPTSDQQPSQGIHFPDCHFIYAQHVVPGLIEQLQDAFLQAGVSDVRVMDAYEDGEDCIVEDPYQVVDFVAWDTTVRLEIAVASVEDQTVLRESIARIVTILRDFPRNAPPYADFGQLYLHFVSPADSLLMRCNYRSALAIVERGADEDPCPNPFAP
jgi:hypothetical protein